MARAKRMRDGLLQASVIPPQRPREWREPTRDWSKPVQERSREVKRAQGVLERANIKLAAVATDSMGVSGCAILAGGSCHHGRVAKGWLRNKIPVLEQALTGLVRAHHRRLRAMQLVPI